MVPDKFYECENYIQRSGPIDPEPVQESILETIATFPGTVFPDSFTEWMFTVIGISIFTATISGILVARKKLRASQIFDCDDSSKDIPPIIVIGIVTLVYPLAFAILYYVFMIIGIPMLIYLFIAKPNLKALFYDEEPPKPDGKSGGIQKRAA